MATKSFPRFGTKSGVGDTEMNRGINMSQYVQPASLADELCLTASEGERFLHIISQSSRIKRHYDLFHLLQGEIQHFLPHQILICAWGDFRGRNLQLDVISAIPGVRTGLLDACDADSLLKSLHLRWLAHGRRPLLLANPADGNLLHSACNCALHGAMRGMSSILVHGTHDARDGSDSLYLAANAGPIVNEIDSERFRHVVDAVIALIDAGSRRVAGLKSHAMSAYRGFASGLPKLSAREEEILTLVSEGRTNIAIAEILTISSFTVKNHVQRILRKLDAANRAEAVAKYRQRDRLPRRERAGKDAVVFAE